VGSPERHHEEPRQASLSASAERSDAGFFYGSQLRVKARAAWPHLSRSVALIRHKADYAAPLQPIAPRRPASWRCPDTLLGDRPHLAISWRAANPNPRGWPNNPRGWPNIAAGPPVMVIYAEPFSRSWAACAFISTPREPAHTAMRHSKVSCGRMDVRRPLTGRSNRRGSSLCQRPLCHRPKLNN